MAISLIRCISALFDLKEDLRTLKENGLFTFLSQNHCHNHAINAQNTCHNYRNDRFHYNFWFQDSHATDSNAAFGCSIGRSEVFFYRRNHREKNDGFKLAKIKAQATPKYPKKKQ